MLQGDIIILRLHKKISHPVKGLLYYGRFVLRALLDIVFLLGILLGWWNWQTHQLEGLAPVKGMGVQIPLPARVHKSGGAFIFSDGERNEKVAGDLKGAPTQYDTTMQRHGWRPMVGAGGRLGANEMSEERQIPLPARVHKSGGAFIFSDG